MQDRYDKIIHMMDNRYNSRILTHILGIGRPYMSIVVDTAAIEITDEDECIFVFNEHFWNELSDDELAFVLAHESMHMMFNHPLQLRHIANMVGVSYKDPTFLKAANLAMDAIINDLLVEYQYGHKLDSAVTGENLIGASTLGMTLYDVFTQVYNNLKQVGTFGCLDNHEWMLNGHNVKKIEDLISSAVDSKDQDGSGDVSDSDADANDDKSHVPGNRAGSGGERNIDVDRIRQINDLWAEILNKICPKIFNDGGGSKRVYNFSKRSRKLYAPHFKKVYLPVEYADLKKRGNFEDENKKPLVIMALDVSGSIPYDWVEIFVKMAHSIPQDKIDLHCVTFDVLVYPYSMNGRPKVTGGCTNFNCIFNYAETHLIHNHYKLQDAYFIIITDGRGPLASDWFKNKFDARKVFAITDVKHPFRKSNVYNVGKFVSLYKQKC